MEAIVHWYQKRSPSPSPPKRKEEEEVLIHELFIVCKTLIDFQRNPVSIFPSRTLAIQSMQCALKNVSAVRHEVCVQMGSIIVMFESGLKRSPPHPPPFPPSPRT